MKKQSYGEVPSPPSTGIYEVTKCRTKLGSLKSKITKKNNGPLNMNLNRNITYNGASTISKDCDELFCTPSIKPFGNP